MAQREKVLLRGLAPHGAFDVILADDDPVPSNRIYTVREKHGRRTDRRIDVTGAELASLSDFWEDERLRRRGTKKDQPSLRKIANGRIPADLRDALKDRFMDPLDFMEAAKRHDSPFATNHFGDREAEFEFIRKLMRAGARVLVGGVLREKWRIKEEHGPYADTLYVDVGPCREPADVVDDIRSEEPDEMDEIAPCVFRVWWD